MTTVEKLTDIAEVGLAVGVAAGAMNAFSPKKKKKGKKYDWF